MVCGRACRRAVLAAGVLACACVLFAPTSAASRQFEPAVRIEEQVGHARKDGDIYNGRQGNVNMLSPTQSLLPRS